MVGNGPEISEPEVGGEMGWWVVIRARDWPTIQLGSRHLPYHLHEENKVKEIVQTI